MKNLKKLALLFTIFFLFSCSTSPQNDKNNTAKTKALEQSGSVGILFDKIPSLLAQLMKKDFIVNVYNKKIIQDSVIIVQKDNFLEMIKNFPNDSNTLGFLLVKIKEKDIKKYSLLKGEEEKVTLFYYYKDSKVNSNYYCFANANSNKNIEIKNVDADIMHDNYNIEVRSNMDLYSRGVGGENTKKIKIPKTKLDDYKLQLDVFDSQIKEFHLAFGKIPNIGAFINSNKSFNTMLLRQKYVQNEGQITFITDVYDHSNNMIKVISYRDLNSLCPQNCP